MNFYFGLTEKLYFNYSTAFLTESNKNSFMIEKTIICTKSAVSGNNSYGSYTKGEMWYKCNYTKIKCIQVGNNKRVLNK